MMYYSNQKDWSFTAHEAEYTTEHVQTIIINNKYNTYTETYT